MTAPLVILTGLPGTGKSTLARALSVQAGWPLLAKDDVKETLVALLPADAALGSRRLSDASFGVLFRLAPAVLAGAPGLVLEGNFRAGEHEAALAACCEGSRVVQALCRVPEPERLRRLAHRAPERSPAHPASAEQARPPECDRFLALPGERLLIDGATELHIQLRLLLDTVRAGGFSPPGP